MVITIHTDFGKPDLYIELVGNKLMIGEHEVLALQDGIRTHYWDRGAHYNHESYRLINSLDRLADFLLANKES